jgi:hypothetical protein
MMRILKLLVARCSLLATYGLLMPVVLASSENKASIDLPAPVGQDMKGITIPQYDPQGHLTMRFSAETARKIDAHQVDLSALTIEFFEKDGKDITVVVPHGIFNLETKILSSDKKTSIKREDFDVVGQSATFDTAKRFGTMQGHVHTEIRNSTPTDDL